jgi:predicted metal-dependent hydrolase/8-oxo-dGTP pyrophosphatase MutT (NUDIX family)
VPAAQPFGVGMVREAEDRRVGKGVRDLVRIDPCDVRDHQVRRIGGINRDEVMPGQRCLELAAEEEIDPGQHDRRHTAFEGNTLVVIDGLRLGLAQIERGDYFEAHESLEDVWRAAEPAEKDFFQGLVHVAVAWYQAGRGNRTGCERQLEKAARRLTPYAPEHRGVGVAFLLLSIEHARRTVADGSLALDPPFLAATEQPYGCSVIVWRAGEKGREYLILHRRTDRGPDYEGDWAWTPPSGARDPDEDADATAKRELREEAGLELPITRSGVGDEGWRVYTAQAPQNAEVSLNEEHDRYRWVSVDEAERLCLPAMVGRSIRAVEARLRSEGA